MSTENISSALPAGYMLRDYRIERAIGRGGFGITYLATEDITGRKVVIKENYPGGIALRDIRNYNVRAVDADNEEVFEWSLRSFVDEARVLTRLRHPHIVQVLTAFRELGTAYYVMDYIGGNSLSKMRPADITEQRLLDILRPMLSALHYIHTLPEMLLHRDIKGDNILITPEGTPVLIDFGAARAVVSNKTQTKIGTVGYAPPEQWASGAVRGPWTDLYALGATCYALITGQNPPDYHDRMFADPGSDLLAKSAKLQQTFSPELLTSIDKAFALRPADRWQSAQEWLAAITPARNTFPIPTSTNSTRVPSIAEPAPPPKITQQAAQAELQQRGISAGEYDSKLYDAAKNGDAELMKLLIDAGTDVNKADMLGDTPLYAAASDGRTECVKLLIAAGADVNKVDNEDITPLYRAADYGHAECVKLLIDAGADVNKAYIDGETPLYQAAKEGHTECVKLLLNAPGIGKSSHTPLSLAVMANDGNKLKHLLDAGADVNRADKDGETPLYWAANHSYVEYVKLLIAAGADVNKADKNGETPLYRAAYCGHAECVKLLIDAGADVNKADKDGLTPLYWAEQRSHAECAKLLRAAGDTGGIGGFLNRLFS